MVQSLRKPHALTIYYLLSKNLVELIGPTFCENSASQRLCCWMELTLTAEPLRTGRFRREKNKEIFYIINPTSFQDAAH